MFQPASLRVVDSCAPGTHVGGSGRNRLRNPRTTNFDTALFKHFKFTETAGFEFRAEAFNVFNHTQWNGVN